MVFQSEDTKLYIVEPKYAAPAIPDFHHLDISDFPLGASGNSAVFRVHYDVINNVPFSGPAKKITINQLGSFEIPDLREYANTCKLLYFDGRMHSARSVYELAHQLPKLQEVRISVDSAQATYPEEKSEYFFRTPPCPNVQTLRIILNVNEEQRDDEFSAENGLLKFVESILMHAGHSFPNLQDLVLQLPANAKLLGLAKSLITAVCPDLKNRTKYLENIFPIRNDAIELFQENDMTSLSSDESLFSDDNSSPEPCFSADRLFSGDDCCSTFNNFNVNIKSADRRIMSLLSDLDSALPPFFLTEPKVPTSEFAVLYMSIKEFMQGSIGDPWAIEDNSFEQLHLKWIEDLVK